MFENQIDTLPWSIEAQKQVPTQVPWELPSVEISRRSEK